LGVSPEFKPAEQHDNNRLKQVGEKFGLPRNFILFVGRLNVRKNIENLLRAVPLLSDKSTAIVIVGKEDWKLPNLQSLLLDPQIKRRIIFTGGVTNEELAGIYALARVFCFPSHAEGFGLPPLEAMASGVPAVVSDRTALPEVCGDAAVYINPEKPESIAAAINLLLTNENMYKLKQNAGLKRSMLFSWKKSADKLMESIMKSV
ncbi:MAG TPA: glycosyltransferase family 1 protein, partial [Agriterribacter sp.]|nr:glycosyltransferase family 1 protein [Agriterribacter sp.]